MSETITKIPDDIKHTINSPSREILHGKLLISEILTKEDHKRLDSFSGRDNSPVLFGPHCSVSHFYDSIICIYIYIITNFITNTLLY